MFNFLQVVLIVLSLFNLLLSVTNAQATPSTLWKSSLGYNASLGITNSSFANSGGMIFSADGSKIYLTETYLKYSSDTTLSARVLTIDAMTGVILWSWGPTTSYSFSSYNLFSQLSSGGVYLYVIGISYSSYAFIASLDATSGALIWANEYSSLYNSWGNVNEYPSLYNSLGNGGGNGYKFSLPLQNSAGDYFVQTSDNSVVCLASATGAVRYTISKSIDNGYSTYFYFDPSLKYLVSTVSNSISTSISAIDSLTPTGVTLWQIVTPGGSGMSRDFAFELTSVSFIAVIANTASNSASLWSLSLSSGQQNTGFPVALSTSAYLYTVSAYLVPSGDAILLTRYDSGAYSLALLDAATGKERWIWQSQ